MNLCDLLWVECNSSPRGIVLVAVCLTYVEYVRDQSLLVKGRGTVDIKRGHQNFWASLGVTTNNVTAMGAIFDNL